MTNDRPVGWNDPDRDDQEGAALFRHTFVGRGMACPPSELLQASKVGVLDPELQEHVTAHVVDCVVCRALADALDDPSIGELTAEERARILRRVCSSVAPDVSRSPWSAWWLAGAAAAALVTLGLAFSLLSQSRNEPPSPGGRRVAGDIHLPAERSVFVLEKAPVRSRGANDLLWRGGRGSDERDALAAALRPYQAEAFAEAARQLGLFVSRYPQSAAGQYYLGVTQLLLNRADEAVIALERAHRLAGNDAELTSDVAWYLGYAYQRSGQRDQAARVLEPLCRSAGPRASQACSALSELSRRAR
jgi:tetratricopeptide (TPR) repeat protein